MKFFRAILENVVTTFVLITAGDEMTLTIRHRSMKVDSLVITCTCNRNVTQMFFLMDCVTVSEKS